MSTLKDRHCKPLYIGKDSIIRVAQLRIGKRSESSNHDQTKNEQNQSPGMFCQKGVLRNFAKFAGKHLCQSLLFKKDADLSLQLFQKRDSGTGVFL